MHYMANTEQDDSVFLYRRDKKKKNYELFEYEGDFYFNKHQHPFALMQMKTSMQPLKLYDTISFANSDIEFQVVDINEDYDSLDRIIVFQDVRAATGKMLDYLADELYNVDFLDCAGNSFHQGYSALSEAAKDVYALAYYQAKNDMMRVFDEWKSLD